MKIAVLSSSEQSIGGGWSFITSLRKGLRTNLEIEWTDWQAADVVLIPSASMPSRDLYKKAKQAGKKMVLRIDNALKNSRNRNSGMTRMREFANGVNALVYQSMWAKNYLEPFLGRDGRVIYNGIDLEIFKPSGRYIDYSVKGKPVYLFSRFNRDESKQWHVAWYEYQMIQRENPNALLVIQGKWNVKRNRQYNFDFFNGEKWVYEGVRSKPEEMARIYRGCDYLLAVYYQDCYSNTYQEFMACGGQLYKPNMSGGTPELVENGPRDCKEMAKEYLEVFRKVVRD